MWTPGPHEEVVRAACHGSSGRMIWMGTASREMGMPGPREEVVRAARHGSPGRMIWMWMASREMG